jgi:hypothetical protein
VFKVRADSSLSSKIKHSQVSKPIPNNNHSQSLILEEVSLKRRLNQYSPRDQLLINLNNNQVGLISKPNQAWVYSVNQLLLNHYQLTQLQISDLVLIRVVAYLIQIHRPLQVFLL